MRTVAQSRLTVGKGSPRGGCRIVGIWMEWQEIKFILVSVGLPALAVASIVQLVPPLLWVF